MINIKGLSLEHFPLTALKKVCDLDFFDGPLLSQFENQHGDQYLYYWCDCDELANRWMVLRVSEANILRLANKFLPLDRIIPKESQDDFVYFIDIGNNNETTNTTLTPIDNIPQEYCPKEGAYLENNLVLTETNSYPVLIEKKWSALDLGKFPRTFSQIYSVLYGLNVLHVPEFEKFPWRGGYSSMHFFRWIADRVPSEHRPSIDSIQYASPGFIRFSLHSKTAMQVARCVSIYKTKNKAIAAAYSDLDTYFRKNKLNDIDSPDSQDWKNHENDLEKMTKDLLSQFEVIDSSLFLTTCPRPFEAAKIASAFYRRIRELAKFEKEGLIRFPPVNDPPKIT